VGTLVEGRLLANFKRTLVRPQESIAEIKFQFQAALLRLSAMLSQYFTCCSMRVYDSASNVIEAHKHARFQTTLTRNAESADYKFEFRKKSQPFIRSDNEA
jgi:hypothetical protein